jgi:hypothetical protein
LPAQIIGPLCLIVAPLDTDPNDTVHRWATKTREGKAIPAYAEADAERLAELLPSLSDRHAALIVDTAGFGNQAAAVAIASADIVLVPVTPGEGDLVEAQRTVAYVGGLSRSTRRTIAVRVVANRIRRGTTPSKRNEFTEHSKRIICNVTTGGPFNGRCPCCSITEVVSPDGKVVGQAEVDHCYPPILSGPLHGWLICKQCHDGSTRGHIQGGRSRFHVACEE